MKLTIAERSATGPVRHHNEDCLGFWQPEDEEERLVHGSIFAIADGVGGLSCGEIASRMAIDAAINTFKDAKRGAKPNQILADIFKSGNLDIYNFGMQSHELRMGTTLSVSIFRNKELAFGHVGDTRLYLMRGGQMKQLTADHTYVAMQIKLGLISEHDAMDSELRSVLTRSMGQNPIVQVDYGKTALYANDYLLQCTDGLYTCLHEQEICDALRRMSPADACAHLISTAEDRGAEDNISVQIVRVDQIRQTTFFPKLSGSPVAEETLKNTSSELEVGHVLDDRFEITEVINRSSMSTVFKGVDRVTQQNVALKVPLLNVESDPAFFARFEREEQIGKSLNHPGILKIVPVERKSRPYIVMEYVEGETLDRLLQNVTFLPVDDALRIASRLCDALEYMHHNGVIHRDLKPSNIMICNDGGLRIMDFGIAKTMAMRRITFGGFSPTMGTPDYMAPEQIKGKRGDERTDIYSLGAILFEMTTGRVPFQGPNVYALMNARLVSDPPAPRSINPEITLEVEEIILHAMEREASHRYPSAHAMKAELDAPQTVHVTGRSKRLRHTVQWKRRFRHYRTVVIGILAPIVLFLMLWLLLSMQAKH